MVFGKSCVGLRWVQEPRPSEARVYCNRVKSTHNVHENKWKRGEVKLCFFPIHGGIKNKKNKESRRPELRTVQGRDTLILATELRSKGAERPCTSLTKGLFRSPHGRAAAADSKKFLSS